MDTNQRQRGAAASLLDPAILVPAVGETFRKLHPRLMIRNPVMFVVEVVATLTTVLLLRDLVTGGARLGFTFQIVLWLWITVLFANLAEAVAEGRGKAQAATLRKARTETTAKRLRGNVGAWDEGRGIGARNRRPGAGRDRRSHPKRWRGRRRHSIGRRIRDHRRIRPPSFGRVAETAPQ